LSTQEWAKFLDIAELALIKRTLLRHISDATYCSDEEAETLTKVAIEIGDLITQREVQNLRTAEESGSWRWPRLQRGND
jgi:hypothetical protein